jgi:hypothetical protein
MAGDPAGELTGVPERVRVTVVQAAPVMFDARQSIRKLAELTADAARSGAKLVVFPEAFISGYPKGHDFGVSVGLRSPEGRDEFRRLFESAIEGPERPPRPSARRPGTTPSISSSVSSSETAGLSTARHSSSDRMAHFSASTAS